MSAILVSKNLSLLVIPRGKEGKRKRMVLPLAHNCKDRYEITCFKKFRPQVAKSRLRKDVRRHLRLRFPEITYIITYSYARYIFIRKFFERREKRILMRQVEFRCTGVLANIIVAIAHLRFENSRSCASRNSCRCC